MYFTCIDFAVVFNSKTNPKIECRTITTFPHCPVEELELVPDVRTLAIAIAEQQKCTCLHVPRLIASPLLGVLMCDTTCSLRLDAWRRWNTCDIFLGLGLTVLLMINLNQSNLMHTKCSGQVSVIFTHVFFEPP